MTETPILDESAVSEIEAQLNSGSLLLPLRVEGWHMSLSDGGWHIKNASDRIVMTVRFVPVEIETGKPALEGNAPARHTAALLNAVPALCATVKHLRDREKQYGKVLGDRLREMKALGESFDKLGAEHTDLQSQLEQLRAENERLNEAAERDRRHLNAKQTLLAGTQARLAQVEQERDELRTRLIEKERGDFDWKQSRP